MTPFKSARQAAPGETGQLVGHAARVIDDGSGPCVGGAQHGAAQLHGAQPRDVQVLVHRQGVTKPGDIAHIHQGRGRGGRVFETQGQLLAKQVFVTNVGGQALALPGQRSLVPATRFEIAQRDVHHSDKPDKTRRHELTKGHQMGLVIAVIRQTSRLQRDHRIGVTLGQTAQRQPYQGH
jgi:hypothetical protein